MLLLENIIEIVRTLLAAVSINGLIWGLRGTKPFHADLMLRPSSRSSSRELIVHAWAA